MEFGDTEAKFLVPINTQLLSQLLTSRSYPKSQSTEASKPWDLKQPGKD